ncbi:MAG: hypothetical protein NTY19_48360 [Planctomycetota bacterium]|nr:hypothetical protein [Planctomycetota bacterium]
MHFAADGSVAGFHKSAGAANLVQTGQPGRGFVVRTFTGAAIDEVRLEKVELRGDALLVSRDGQPPRLTFQVTRQGRYLALKLKRVEGLPTVSLAALHFELNCTGTDVKVLSLDYMTRVQQQGGAIRVQFNYLWHRKPGDPLGGFALYVANNDEEEDDALANIWSHEDLPRPMLSEPWTREHVLRWIDDYYGQFKDLTTMILAAKSEAELYELTAVAQQRGIKIIYLHTDTWRGEYWPMEHSHVHVNQQVFPRGRADLKRYSEYLAQRGIHLALHYVCGGIGPKDPQRIAAHVDRNLAAWGHGELAHPIEASTREIRFRPAAGCEFPLVSGIGNNSPGVMEHIWEPHFVRIDEEIVRVGEFVDLDQPIWTLRNCQRGYGATAAAAHAPGAETVGLLAAYGQNFVPDTDSPLLVEMAREYAEFANEVHLGQLEYDGYEIHGQYPWGPRKFSDLVARHLDHAVVSNTSNGAPVASNLELRFSKIRKINQFGYHTVNLSFQLDDHRPATSILDAWFELSSLIANGVRRFQVLKPEPMFGVSTEILATHGLTEELFTALALWREVLPRMSQDQLAAMRQTFTPFGNHMQGKDLFQVRRAADHYEVIPTRVMVRKQGDVPWLVGQEFGPVGPRQIGRPGQRFELENPFHAQPAAFVIRVLAEHGESRGGPGASAAPRAGDSIVDSYRSGADAVGQSPADRAAVTAVSHAPQNLQPKATEIHNQRFAQFAQEGDALWMHAENPRAEALKVEKDLPTWPIQFSMNAGRGLALELIGDGSGAVLLVQLHGRGVRDYVVKIDFTGPRSVTIPAGETSWADGNWGWRFGAKHFDYNHVSSVSLGFGLIPPRTNPKVRVANLRTLVDVPSKLIDPVIHTGEGHLAVHGEITSGCYLRYDGGTSASVHDRNWKKLKDLKVTLENYRMPAGQAPVWVDVVNGSPRPWLELQTVVTGAPMIVPIE